MALKHWICVITLLAFVQLAGVGYADNPVPQKSLENNIKAAYLYNFVKFVGWPKTAFQSKDASVDLCVLGKDALYENLLSLEEKQVAGRPLSVRMEWNKASSEGCHILYIGDTEKKNIRNIVAAVSGLPVLTVSSVDDFAEQGGMIGFVRMGNNIRFKINLDAVQRSGLTMSSRLLKLALIVGEASVKDAGGDR